MLPQHDAGHDAQSDENKPQDAASSGHMMLPQEFGASESTFHQEDVIAMSSQSCPYVSENGFFRTEVALALKHGQSKALESKENFSD